MQKNKRTPNLFDNAEVLNTARQLAQSGRYPELLALYRPLIAAESMSAARLLDLGVLLTAHGFLTDARACYEKAQSLAANDLAAAINLANLLRDAGHTAGSRLTAFAHRPAPALVSWLGYFATTGLPYMDAVLLDAWHAPKGSEAQFVEPIIRLP